MSDYQDWKPVVIGKSTQRRHKQTKDEVADAQRKGKGTTEKKYDVGSNKQRRNDKDMRKVDEETEEFHVEHVTLNLRQAIQKARQAKEWNQKQLAQAINEKASVINEYESGRAIPSNSIISKMERALGTKLPRGKK